MRVAFRPENGQGLPHGTRNTQYVDMGLIDFILNLAGILLWLNWLSLRLDPLMRTTPVTLAGTLRRAEPHRLKRWHFLAALGALLLLRALLYWQIGSAADWTPNLPLGDLDIVIPFRSDNGWRMLLFSGLSFAVMHMQPLGLPTLATLGIVLGFAFLRTGNLATCIMVHGLWNGGVFILMRALA